MWSNGASLRIKQSSVLYPIGMMSFLLVTRSALWLYRHFHKKNGSLSLQRVFLQTLRDWIPFILISFIYENLRDLTRFFYTHDIAGTLMAWDVKIFGVELTQWSQRFFHPLMTDYMAFAYALYFILPLIIMYMLSYRNKRTLLREVIMALSLTFLVGFLCYVFLPCSPPRFFLEAQYTNPPQLYGWHLFNALQGNWDRLSVIPHGAFPSLHVGISTIALIYAFRFRKVSRLDCVLYWIYVPLIVSLWVSTIYLRHHWFVDILAGWLLALLSCWIAPVLVKSWDRFRQRVVSATD
jgi:membrane-associated phospholipid phosphatase